MPGMKAKVLQRFIQMEQDEALVIWNGGVRRKQTARENKLATNEDPANQVAPKKRKQVSSGAIVVDSDDSESEDYNQYYFKSVLESPAPADGVHAQQGKMCSASW